MTLTSMRSICLLFLMGGAIACGGDDGTGPPAGAGFSIVAKPPASDTVQAAPLQALVVQVRDTKGKLTSGHVVRFESAAAPDGPRRNERGVFVCTLQTPQCATSVFVSDTTDALGRVKAQVRLGTLAGPTWVILTAPEFGIRDSVAFTVEPGAVARVLFALHDTTLVVGKGYKLSVSVADRFNNARTELPTLTADGSIVTIDANRDVTTRSVGRGFVAAKFNASVDTAWTSVVPTGAFVAIRVAGFGTPPATANGIIEVNFDGTGLRSLQSGLPSPQDWYAPSAATNGDIVYHAGDYPVGRVYIASADGAQRRLTQDDATFNAERYPRLSSDGWVYFSGRRPNDYSYSLWRIRVDGSGLEPMLLPENSSIDWRPAPSPDGKTIAYTSNRAGFSEIRTMNVATRTVTALGVTGISPRWSPDGSLIAYADENGGGLNVMSPTGAGRRRVSRAGRFYGEHLDWTPDGQWLIAGLGDRLELVRVSDGTSLPLTFSIGMGQPTVRR